MESKPIEQARGFRSARSISKQERLCLMREQEASGLTLREFALQKGINFHSLVDWRKTESQERRMCESVEDVQIRFNEVIVAQPTCLGGESSTLSVDWPLEVALPGGVVARGASAQELATFIHLLNH